jgi:hypothetical protein
VLDKSLLLTYQRSLFRPRFDDGLAVDTQDMMIRHDFLYIPEKVADDSDSDSPLTPPSSSRGRLERPDD